MAYLQKFTRTEELSPTDINVGFFDGNLRSSAVLDSSSITNDKPKSPDNGYSEFPPPQTPGHAPPLKTESSVFFRPVRAKHVILIIVGCVLVIGLAAGTAVAIILTQRDSSSSSSLSSTTLSPSTSKSSIPPAYITYDGSLKLVQPWKGEEEELRRNFTTDMENVVHNTSLEESYLGSSVRTYREEKRYLAFTMSFTSKLFDIPLSTTPESAQMNAYGFYIETVLKNEVIKGETTLAIDSNTIEIVADYIPRTTTPSVSFSSSPSSSSTSSASSSSPSSSSTSSPSSSSTSSPSSSSPSSSTTFVLPSPTTTVPPPKPSKCFPLTFELCRSVGYNITYLPNIYGDTNQENIITQFYQMNKATINSNCSSLSLFYLCGWWFPECGPDNAPMYPCADVCEAVNRDCEGKVLSLDCSFFNTSKSCLTPPTDLISTTPTPTTMATTSSVTTTTPLPYTCSTLTLDHCRNVGYNITYLPNMMYNRDLQAAINQFISLPGSVINSTCSPLLTFYLCGLWFPECSSSNTRLYPCKSVCEAIEKDCGANMAIVNCSYYDKFDSCKMPPPELLTSTTTTSPTTTRKPAQCVHLSFEPCRKLGYTKVFFPNGFGDRNEREAITMFNYYAQTSLEKNCSQNGLQYFCAMLFPKCDETASPIAKIPCSSFCREVSTDCASHLPFRLDCSVFGSDLSKCLETPPRPSTLAPTTTVKTAACLPQTYDFCMSEGYNATYLPNWFADTLPGTVSAFEKYALSTIKYGCSNMAKFFYCGMFFPQCEPIEGNVTLPCRSVCEEMTAKCSKVWTFPMDCDTFSNDTSKCLLPPPPPTKKPPSTTTPVSTAAPTARCEKTKFEQCRMLGFNVTYLPNFWGSRTQGEALKYYIDYGEKPISLGCSEKVMFFVCSVLFPQCEDGLPIGPCKHVCQEVTDKCTKAGLFRQVCKNYSEAPNKCLSPPARLTCPPGEMSCFGTPKCVSNNLRCNGNNDCGDWSDETNCTCNEFEYQCKMGMCIKSFRQCDKMYDCPDESDEENCTCPNGQFTCPDRKCIMSEWVCDGQNDCKNGADEARCGSCSNSEFACLSGECIPSVHRCDGVNHCKDHSDEKQCIFGPEGKNPFMLRFKQDGLLPVCASEFSTQLADQACQKLGHIGHSSWSREKYPTYKYVYLDGVGPETTVIGNATLRDTCTDSYAVVLKCKPKECGNRKARMVSFIVNGNSAIRGSWPWQVSIQRVGKHYCGGSLISPNFVVTAAHCVEAYVLDFRYIEVVLGATNISANEHTQKRSKVKRLTIHNHIYHVKNDIALIELSEPVEYTEYIRPICLPGDDDVFTRSNECFAVGWGMKVYNGDRAQWLQEAKMTLWDTNKCNSSIAWNGSISNTHMCAGYYSGMISTCVGDSGGPLMCQTNDNSWKLVGVASYVSPGCTSTARPGVFSDVVVFKDWIKEKTECKFKCKNGQCLYDKSLLCNRKNDCGDNSDETEPCNISVNCTFEDPFLCGYKTEWSRIYASDFDNHYPLYDHTLGNYPGYFMTARTSGRHHSSPKFTIDVPHCAKFFYHMRGQVEEGLQVWLHEPAGKVKWTPVFKQSSLIAPDKWLQGTVDLHAGTFELYFSSNDRARISVDDVSVLPGSCSQIGCTSSEFQCGSGKSTYCVPKESRCNIIVDCDGGQDETGCTASEYKCDFENGLLCGLEQDSEDTASGEWRIGNSSATPRNIEDHTHQNSTGNMLYLETKNLFEQRQVRMTQKLFLNQSKSCFTFYYYSTSSASFEIQYKPSSGETNTTLLWRIKNRKTHSWAKTQVTIPLSGKVILDFIITAGPYLGTYRPVITIDDLQIKAGACGDFECERPEWIPCLSESYCLPNSSFCDRVVDCSDNSDEAGCSCSVEEYKCPDGPCIPLSKTCNRVNDCADGSDEGQICDKYHSVSCDFEQDYICGYSINSAVYKWRQHSGPTQTKGTGPKIDHTFKNATGHYMYADGTDGKYGDVTEMETPTFVADNVSFVFSYNIFSMVHLFKKNLANLTIIAKDSDSESKKQLYFDKADGTVEWKTVCLKIPKSRNISVVFLAQRGNRHQADVAVDDIILLRTSCAAAGYETKVTTETPSTNVTIPIQAECSPGKKACNNGFCINSAYFCDGQLDCQDKSDEVGC